MELDFIQFRKQNNMKEMILLFIVLSIQLCAQTINYGTYESSNKSQLCINKDTISLRIKTNGGLIIDKISYATYTKEKKNKIRLGCEYIDTVSTKIYAEKISDNEKTKLILLDAKGKPMEFCNILLFKKNGIGKSNLLMDYQFGALSEKEAITIDGKKANIEELNWMKIIDISYNTIKKIDFKKGYLYTIFNRFSFSFSVDRDNLSKSYKMKIINQNSIEVKYGKKKLLFYPINNNTNCASIFFENK